MSAASKRIHVRVGFHAGPGTQFTCLTSTRVQILTQRGGQWWRALSAPAIRATASSATLSTPRLEWSPTRCLTRCTAQRKLRTCLRSNCASRAQARIRVQALHWRLLVNSSSNHEAFSRLRARAGCIPTGSPNLTARTAMRQRTRT
jgi:hypothetical protein